MLLVTFFLTVVFDLTVAIEVGLLIACVLFMKRVMETTEISVIRDEIDPSAGLDVILHEEPLAVPKGVEVYEINGPYFFGIATRFEELMAQIGDRPRVRIIRMRKVPFIDSTGIHNLTTLCEMSHRSKITVVLSGVNDDVRAALERSVSATCWGAAMSAPTSGCAGAGRGACRRTGAIKRNGGPRWDRRFSYRGDSSERSEAEHDFLAVQLAGLQQRRGEFRMVHGVG